MICFCLRQSLRALAVFAILVGLGMYSMTTTLFLEKREMDASNSARTAVLVGLGGYQASEVVVDNHGGSGKKLRKKKTAEPNKGGKSNKQGKAATISKEKEAEEHPTTTSDEEAPPPKAPKPKVVLPEKKDDDNKKATPPSASTTKGGEESSSSSSSSTTSSSTSTTTTTIRRPPPQKDIQDATTTNDDDNNSNNDRASAPAKPEEEVVQKQPQQQKPAVVAKKATGTTEAAGSGSSSSNEGHDNDVPPPSTQKAPRAHPASTKTTTTTTAAESTAATTTATKAKTTTATATTTTDATASKEPTTKKATTTTTTSTTAKATATDAETKPTTTDAKTKAAPAPAATADDKTTGEKKKATPPPPPPTKTADKDKATAAAVATTTTEKKEAPPATAAEAKKPPTNVNSKKRWFPVFPKKKPEALDRTVRQKVCKINPFQNALHEGRPFQASTTSAQVWLEEERDKAHKRAKQGKLNRKKATHERFFAFENVMAPCGELTCIRGKGKNGEGDPDCEVPSNMKVKNPRVCGLRHLPKKQPPPPTPAPTPVPPTTKSSSTFSRSSIRSGGRRPPPKPVCIIYSMGQHHEEKDWEFDRVMLNRTDCQVHTFDCTGPLARDIPEDLVSNPDHFFHHVCLSTSHEQADLDKCVGPNKYCGAKWTLWEIQKQLNHKRVDILQLSGVKEGMEWQIFHSWPILIARGSDEIMLPMQVTATLQYRSKNSDMTGNTDKDAEWKSSSDIVALHEHLIKVGYTTVAKHDWNPNVCPHCTDLTLMRTSCPDTALYLPSKWNNTK